MGHQAVDSDAHSLLTVTDRLNSRVLGQVTLTGPGQAGEVIDACAKVQPLWSLLRVSDRARYMRRVAQAIIDEFDDLLEALASEQVRSRSEIATLELLPAIDALIWIAEAGAQELEHRRVGIHRSMFLTKRARITYEPLGVVAVIGAGSAPFAQPIGQIAGALLAGNGVVFKPAKRACLAGERVLGVFGRAGLPEGLVRLIHGGPELGVALAAAPVDKVLFTGSATVGRAVARACVSQNREVLVEAGGKDAMLVLSDAHIQKAAAAAVWAGFAAAGQARGSIERVYVLDEVADGFLETLVRAVGTLRVGDPRGEQNQIGPLASTRRLRHVHELILEAVDQGARVLCGAEEITPRGETKALFYAPTVITDVTHQMRLMREPVDGPVLAVMAVESIPEAIALANDCEFRLGASVWSADRYQALRIARQLRTGMVWLNDHLPGPMMAQGPWGASVGGGLGHTLGRAGLRACAQPKLITWDPPGASGQWWGLNDQRLTHLARTVAELRSARDAHREHAWRHGALSVARVGMRALRQARN